MWTYTSNFMTCLLAGTDGTLPLPSVSFFLFSFYVRHVCMKLLSEVSFQLACQTRKGCRPYCE